jgi:hypothetical protein
MRTDERYHPAITLRQRGGFLRLKIGVGNKADGVPLLAEGRWAAPALVSIESGCEAEIRKEPTSGKKQYYIVARASHDSAAVIERVCQTSGEILLPIVNLTQGAASRGNRDP